MEHLRESAQLVNLLDLIEAQDARDKAIQQVTDHADPVWIDRVTRLVMHVAAEHPEGFTTDDVWHECERSGIAQPAEPRALGAIMLRLARDSSIHKTGRYVTSRRKACHARPIPVWRLG